MSTSADPSGGDTIALDYDSDGDATVDPVKHTKARVTEDNAAGVFRELSTLSRRFVVANPLNEEITDGSST